MISFIYIYINLHIHILHKLVNITTPASSSNYLPLFSTESTVKKANLTTSLLEEKEMHTKLIKVYDEN